MSTRVSVASAQKPKPKATFKFLRRDEGRLSYSAAQDSPQKEEDAGLSPRSQAARRDSKSLRDAIAQDMRAAKTQDPFGDVVVAVPKKPPPSAAAPAAPAGSVSTSAATASAPRGNTTPRRVSSRAPAKKPEWVDPEVPPVTQPEARRPVRDVSDSAPPPRDDPARSSVPRGNGRHASFADEYDSPSRDVEAAARPAPAQRRSANPVQPRPSNRFSDPAADALDDVYTEEPPRNYFRNAQPSQRSAPAAGPTAGSMRPAGGNTEDKLMAQLEVEVYEAQQERAKYMKARNDLERERERFDTYRFNTQQQFEEERHNLDALRADNQRAANKDVKSMEERYRNVSGLLATERETNRRLADENDSLRTQLENLTSAMRDMQGNHKSETARLRRDVESLQRRNTELLAMAKDQQIHALDSAPTTSSVPAIADRDRSRAAADANQPTTTTTTTSAVRDASVSAARADGPAAKPVPKKRAVAAFPSEEEALFVAEPTNTPRAGAPVQTQVVMDFSSRNKDDEAKERRVRELEQRMKSEEAEMQRRRQQREQEAEERRQTEGPSEKSRPRSTSPPPSTASTGARTAKSTAASEPAKAAVPRIHKLAQDQGEDTAVSAPTTEVSRERKEAGHPVHTPRVTAGAKRPATTGPAAARPPIAPKAKRRIPSRSELVADVAQTPNEELPNDRVVSENAIGDNPNKRELLYRSGKREIHYANGTVKVVLPSGHTILHFTNGDVKCSFPSGSSSYWYSGAETLHTQEANGIQIYEFKATNQTERHMPDGTKEILYPDGIFKVVHKDGSEETLFPEGETSS